MKIVQSGEDVMDSKTSRHAPGRSRKVVSASVVALTLACSVLPEPAFAQLDLGSLAGGMIGGMLAGRGGGRSYGYAPHYRTRHAYVGRHEEPRHAYAGHYYHAPRVAQTRSVPHVGRAAVSTPTLASAPPVEHRNASGPGAGSLH